jgi:transketolase
MCTFFFAKHSQTTLYRNNVTSLAKIIQLYGDDDLTISGEVQSELQKFLAKFFSSASVTVSVEEDGDDPGINLKVEASVTDSTAAGSTSTSVGYSLTTRDSALKSIVNVSNGTVVYTS